MTRMHAALLASVVGTAALAASGPAIAQQPSERGPYLGLTAGTASFKDTCEGFLIPCDESDTAWRFFAGHQFGRHGALELGYANLGAVTASGPFGGLPASFRVEAFAWDLSAVFRFPLGPRFSLLGRVGAYRAELDGREEVFGGVNTASEKSSGFTYGLGAQYQLTRRLGLRAEWQRYDSVGSEEVIEDDIDVVSVGVLWKF